VKCIPIPHYSGLGTNAPLGRSWYNSLQSMAERRFSKGYTLQFQHTWSKFLEATGYLNGGDASPERVISDLDRAHRFTMSGVWELPFARASKGVAKHVAGGWQLQAVWQRATGAPIGFGNVLLTGDIRSLAPETRTLDRWFNTSLFNRNPAEQLGSNYRTVSTRFAAARVPGVETWDISAVKNWSLTERWRLQLRGEFLNALNRTNLAAPNTDPVNSQFGRVTAVNGFPRYIHVGLKLSY
jgi:hypothetical protein